MADLNYHHLRYFWAVAHDGNLTRTAQRLNLSQSALSIQIKRLEERLGHRLFERRGRQLHLTEAGRIALDHADAIFAAGQDLLGTLSGTGQMRKVVRVGALATLSRNFQISFLRPLLTRLDVEVIVRSGTMAGLMSGLETLNLDVALTNQPPARDAATQQVAHRLAEQHVSLIGVPERLQKGASLEDLLAKQPVVLPTVDSTIRSDFDALMDQRGIRPQIAAEVDDMAMMRLFVREGVGLGALPPIVVTDELETGTLREAHPLPGIVETFYAITQARQFPNPLVRELLSASTDDLA